MIYTVTFNPSLDYIVNVKSLKRGNVNRSTSEYYLAGGKGINVSTVLTNFGIPNIALGFIAGFVGNEIQKKTRELGCTTEFIKVKGNSRINIKLKSEEETEINAKGPEITEEDIKKLVIKLKKLQKNDILIFAGSVPSNIEYDIYGYLMEKVKEKHLKVIVDATGRLLTETLRNEPFLIKPNKYEIEEIFKEKINSEAKLIEKAKCLQSMGAKNVLVSLAEKGAVLVSEKGEVLELKAPKGQIVNSVGAGDSMVAGFITGYLESKDYAYSLKMGVAAGSASAFSKDLTTKEEMEEILLEI